MPCMQRGRLRPRSQACYALMHTVAQAVASCLGVQSCHVSAGKEVDGGPSLKLAVDWHQLCFVKIAFRCLDDHTSCMLEGSDSPSKVQASYTPSYIKAVHTAYVKNMHLCVYSGVTPGKGLAALARFYAWLDAHCDGSYLKQQQPPAT